MPDIHLIVLGLGSNVGDSRAILLWAVERLTDLLGPLEVAPLYRSAPISPVPQADFLNTVVLARLDGRPPSKPQKLLRRLQELERQAGRQRVVRFGPRTLDLDLLLYGDLVVSDAESEPRLVVPHPRMRERRFVLAPLCDLRPDLKLPPDGALAKDLLATLGTDQRIEKIDWN